MTCGCGCCGGACDDTPLSLANAPGLGALRYRLGEHGDFLAGMLAGLSSAEFPALAALRTRDPSDPSIALLDAGATMLDVLTFYQERILNEGFLRTAVERRSLFELARLVGYRPRPGLSASVFLAFSVEQGARLTIPAGTKAQSVPGQDELPQTFETTSPLEARAEWNQLGVRRTRPQIAPIPDPARGKGAVVLYLKGVTTGLRKGDPILVELPATARPRVYRVTSLTLDPVADRTRVELMPWRTIATVEQLRNVALAFSMLGSPLAATAAGKQALARLAKLIDATGDPNASETVVVNRAREVTDDLIEEFSNLPQNATRLAPWLSALISALADAIDSADFDAATLKLAEAPIFDWKTATRAATVAQPVGPRNPAALRRDLGVALAARSASTLGIIGRLQPALRDVIPSLVRNENIAPPVRMRVYALRSRASVFGHNAPKKLTDFAGNVPVYSNWTATDMRAAENPTVLHLDAKYEAITSDSWVVVDTSSVPPIPGREPQVAHFPLLATRATRVNTNESRSAYGLSGPSTSLTINDSWILFPDEGTPPPPELLALVPDTRISEGPFDIVRRTSVLAASEELELAEAPIESPLCEGTGGNPIELADLSPDLTPGRWVIVSGERTDVPGTSGITGTELRMIADVRHDVVIDDESPRAGEQMHTFISLASSLAYCYERSTVTVWGNVIDATHGETRRETLGSGNGAESFQRFTLKAAPLTYTSVPTPDGAASSLEVRVNEVRWHERDILAGAEPIDHVYVPKLADDDKTSITFGDGRNGARLPSGRENVQAVYRTGIGRTGNVDAGRITLLSSRPLGLKEVVNPLRSSGGADADSVEQLRRNIPIALQALDRLISVRDHADFARAFAGIGKASATKLSDGRRQIVHVTIAGVGDIPILDSSDLFANLQTAFTRLGDIRQPVQLAVRELILLVIAARVRVNEDYRWDLVEPHIRKALLDAFSFEKRELGQAATSSEVIATIQRVPGVAYVDLDTFGGIPECVGDPGPPPSRRAITPDEIAALVTARLAPPTNGDGAQNECSWLPPFCPVVARLAGPDENGLIRPAQLAILSPDTPNTLVLSSIQ